MLLPAGSHPVRGQDGLALCPWPQGGHPSAGRLDDYVVASRLWRRGIGTRLTERVVEEARRWGLVRPPGTLRAGQPAPRRQAHAHQDALRDGEMGGASRKGQIHLICFVIANNQHLPAGRKMVPAP